jgi:hypothetical protein
MCDALCSVDVYVGSVVYVCWVIESQRIVEISSGLNGS